MSTLVTGTPGSGKTTLVQYAERIGDARFFDADEIEGLCEWRDLQTGEVLGLVTEYRETGEDSWYEQYGWYWRSSVLKTFLEQNPQAIICGASENVTDHYELFETVIIIRVTEEQLLNNLAQPTRNNPFGKTENQRKGFMEWQDYLIEESKRFKSSFVFGNDTVSTYEEVCKKV